MEHCPNCGKPGRPGAKFCTTCGFRFPGDASDSEATQDETDSTVLAMDDEPGLFPGAATDGWPSPPPSTATNSGGWDQHATASESELAQPGEIEQGDSTANTWAASATESWPAASDTAVDAPATDPEPSLPEAAETASADNADPAIDHQTETADAVARAMRLLDELQQTIAEIGLQAPSGGDFSGVISDLEVAVNPPGAMATDDVADLRDALLAARERPRDIDTIVDLTKRIDAMLALVIAYDRTIAAIERSLEALRGDRVTG
jgi:zinc ribbon protein